MAAPVAPEPVKPPTEPAAPASPPTPTNPPAAEPAADNRRMLDLYEATLRENHQRITRMERELEESRAATAAAAAPPTATQTPDEFWKNPAQHIRELIKEETTRAVKPLYDFKDRFEARSAYDTLKDRFRSDPRYKEIFPKIEGAVDQLLSRAEKIDENIMNTAVLSAAGALALGMIPQPGATAGNQPATPQTPANPNTPAAPTPGAPVQRSDLVTPPHLRPSGAAQHTTDEPAGRKVELTELQKRLARENGMTEQQYVDWLELPADKVTTAKIGIEPKAK